MRLFFRGRKVEIQQIFCIHSAFIYISVLVALASSCHSFCFRRISFTFLSDLRKIEGILYPKEPCTAARCREKNAEMHFTFDMIVCRRARTCAGPFSGDVIGEPVAKGAS